MGQERIVRFESEPPSWEAIRAELTRQGIPCQLRMIDGLPAFPDDSPESGWRELRIGFDSGMVTLRRAPQQLTCVMWGNADEALLQSCESLVAACTAAGVHRPSA
jgi:hypothetical protein